jgi:uncharacterized protein YecE (DUF72 family)
MHTTPTYHCYLGASGWDHTTWIGAFYPEDLPPEWRLSYYNTSFECVYLPYTLWSQASLETLAAWSAETLDHFCFLLEAPPVVSSANKERIAALGNKALIVTPHAAPTIIGLEPGADLKQLARTLQAQISVPPLYLISVSNDYAQLEQARILLEVLGY